jgi:hypothetical protein
MTSIFTLTHQIPDEDVGVNLEEHCDEICKIRVAQRAGYNCSVSAEGRIPLSAKHVWEILCHPVRLLLLPVCPRAGNYGTP